MSCAAMVAAIESTRNGMSSLTTASRIARLSSPSPDSSAIPGVPGARVAAASATNRAAAARAVSSNPSSSPGRAPSVRRTLTASASDLIGVLLMDESYAPAARAAQGLLHCTVTFETKLPCSLLRGTKKCARTGVFDQFARSSGEDFEEDSGSHAAALRSARLASAASSSIRATISSSPSAPARASSSTNSCAPASIWTCASAGRARSSART